jgi:NADPH:quinone reductase-like Zn-dependent oxidoreductase
VEQVGDGVRAWVVGDEVIGYTDSRASQAELGVVEAANVTRRPPGVAWDRSGPAKPTTSGRGRRGRELQVPIAHVYPLDQVRDAYRDPGRGHTRGKIVLVP